MAGKDSKGGLNLLAVLKTKYEEFKVDVPVARKGETTGNLEVPLDFRDWSWQVSTHTDSDREDGTETDSRLKESRLKKNMESEGLIGEDVRVKPGPTISTSNDNGSNDEVREIGNKNDEASVAKPMKKRRLREKKAKQVKVAASEMIDMFVVYRLISGAFEGHRAQRDAGSASQVGDTIALFGKR